MAPAFVMPEPVTTWLGGAAFNVGWFILYAASTILLWNRAERRSES